MKEVLYVTLHKSLQRGVKEKMDRIGYQVVDVVLESELWEYIQGDYSFVFDEYYTGLTKTKL